MKNLYKRSIIKQLVFALLILCTSADLFSQRRGFGGVEGKLDVDWGASYLSDNSLGSLFKFKPGISFMLIQKSRRKDVEKIYLGMNVSCNMFVGGAVSSTFQSNVYTGFNVAKNLVACVGVTAEMLRADGYHYNDNKLIPGIHTAINYFINEKFSIAFELDYHGKQSYIYESQDYSSYDNGAKDFDYSLIPTIKLRVPLSEYLKEINITI